MQPPFKLILYVMGPAPCPECIPVLGLQERATAPLLVLLTFQRLTRLWGRRQEEHSGKTDLTHEEVWRILLPYNTTRKYEQKDTQEAKGDKRGVEKVTLDLGSRVRTGGLENIEQLCRKLRKVGFLAGYAE